MEILKSERIKKLPPYLFAEIDKAKRKAVKAGKDVIDLGVGDPDLPTPENIINALRKASEDTSNHRYALDAGMPELRKAIADWYMKRFGVKLDPETEILPLIGSKEGLAHIPLAFINPGDQVLIPEPAYPVYRSATWFAGGEPVYMSLLESNGYLPDLEQLRKEDLKKTKMMFLNYPNNPTGASCSIGFFDEVVEFARKNNIIVCHDAAYTEMYFGASKPPSFLQSNGARDVGVEFHSLSKTYNMTGWRIGFAVGNADIIAGLAKVKANIDSGIFGAVQRAGIEALTNSQSEYERLMEIYKKRRDVFVQGLNNLGWKVPLSDATFYVWIPVPPGYSSQELVMTLLEKASIITTPGNGFGQSGEGYIRAALTVNEERLNEAVDRIGKIQ
ncbi:MAG: LL-diaminopimelate aminotransferase [Candidatus Theseobacter exili]|nr:LL-diaminopimelate aminotransferase [Candidatus Theseobacter exili]